MVAPQSRQLMAARGEAGAASVVEIDHVPFVPQTPFHCGPAALATVLGHRGIDAPPEALVRAVFVAAREGSLQVEMLSAPRTRGALATVIPGSLNALRRELLAGNPVVVLQNLGLSWWPLWHYAVVVGMNLDEGHVVLRSGTTRRELLPLPTFELTWARSQHWAFVVTHPGVWPVTATQRDAETAAVGFERAAAPADALRSYTSLLQRWPDSHVAAVGQGNAWLALGEPAAAAVAFERAAQARDSAVAWNNLAVARARAGDTKGAADAAQRALHRAQTLEASLLAAVQDTVAKLQRGDVP